MQPHAAPGAGTSFSRSHQVGCPPRPSRLPGGMTPLIPVLRKTIHLDAFPQNHVTPNPSRPGLGAGACGERGRSLGVRKLSSVSLTLHHTSRPLASDPRLGREASPQGRGRPPLFGWTPSPLAQGGRAHPGNPRGSYLPTPCRSPAADRPMVTSCLSLPFQAPLAQNPAGPVGLGPGGQVLVPTRASPGSGKQGARVLLRPRLHFQRGPTGVPAMRPEMDTGLDKARPGVVRRPATRATHRLNAVVRLATPSLCRGNPSIESPVLKAKLAATTDLSSSGKGEPDVAMGPVTPKPVKLRRAGALDTTSGPRTDIANRFQEARRPEQPDLPIVAPPGPAGGTFALVPSKQGMSPVSAVTVTPDPAAGEAPQHRGTDLTPPDTPSSSSSGGNAEPALGPVWAEPTTLDLDRETEGM